MYDRIYNFSAGPSMLPLPVLEQARDEMLNCSGSGMSVNEMSHRSKVFLKIYEDAVALVRRVLGVPDNYKVLFMQGGATLQFACVPLNLMKTGHADYILTGNFAKKAYEEGLKYGEARVAGSTKDENFCRIPRQSELDLDPNADYVHICFNNTIYGTHWDYVPETGSVPLVADMSSCIFSEPVDVSKFGVIYAGVQKNLAPSGMALVIIREALIREDLPKYCPTLCSYEKHASNDSMYNTPNCWSIYMVKLVLEWIVSIGGIDVLYAQNQKKAALLYDYLDQTDFYQTAVSPESRSLMNVTFRCASEALDAEFASESGKHKMSNLKGHRSVGGMRASIYNAMPIEGVEHLIEFMKEFEKAHTK